MPGGVIVLNGTSSVGKSTIALELQTLLTEPHLHTGLDHFLERVPQRLIGPREPGVTRGWEVTVKHGVLTGPPTITATGHRILHGVYDALWAYARTGNHLIVDDVIYDETVASLARAALGPGRAYWVGLDCDLPEAERRERARGDRAPGGARAFHDLVHRYTTYDLRLDVTASSAPAAAAVIAAGYSAWTGQVTSD